jgi:hypothetical protein
MTRTFYAQTAAAIALMTAIALTPICAQQPPAASSDIQASAQYDTPLALAKLELTMSQATPDSREFGEALGAYMQLVAKSNDRGRAYFFFSALAAKQKTPNATLLATRASSSGLYIQWLSQQNLKDQVGLPRIEQISTQMRADYEQALQIDPQNFSALFGYAIYEGYRPGAQAHQKELLSRLDALRTSRPYYPWQLVDRLEKTGKFE